jgi:hypothetical protein
LAVVSGGYFPVTASSRDVGVKALVLALFFLAAPYSVAQEPPLVDGDCDEYSRLKAKQIAISNDITLSIFQDKHFVWLCYGYPEGSFATVDLKLKTPALSETLNLHVSAQLGEWPVTKPELIPPNPESDLWWNAKGWTANPVWINGMDRTGAQARYRFKNAKAREFQLSKRRFGRGEWQFSMEIRRIKGSDGNFYDVVFPRGGELYTLKTF